MDATFQWASNVIVADADYVDRVAFDLTVNFERIIGRRIPQADMAHWAECVALDGGLRQGNHIVQLILIHDMENVRMANFTPGHHADELDGKAFKSRLGEFSITSVSTEPIVTRLQLFTDMVDLLCAQPEVERLMLIPADDMLPHVMGHLRNIDDRKHVTLFTMQPVPTAACRHELLGYSLMSALGIKASEIKAD